jgi:peptide/nickel transport system substrate-binding protein
LDRWDKGAKIVLEANPDFWDGAPSLERIEVILVPDNTARAQAFEAGDLDLIMSPLAPQDIKRLTDDDRFGHTLRPGVAITYLNFNTRKKHLSDPRMRRALSMLVDRDTILSQIYEGTDDEATSVLLPVWWVYDETIEQPTFDPEGGTALLAELGWDDTNGDGVRDKNDAKLVVELGTHSEDINRVQTLEFLQNAFTRAGIEARVWVSDWPSFSVRRDAGDYEIILLGWTQLVDPDRGTYDQFHSQGGLNWGGYENTEVDGLLERGRSTSGRNERASAYRAAASIIADEVPYYVLSYQGYQVFYSTRVRGFEPDPRGMVRSLAGATILDEHP